MAGDDGPSDHLRFLVFYLLCAIAGALFHGLVGMTSQAPLIGASGAIAGVVAAYLMLHPRVKIWVLVFMRVPLPLPAFVPLILWTGQQFVMLALEPDGSVSWGAHVGGIVAGAVSRPISAGVAVLLYVDMRMRREGLDLVLQTATASGEPTGDEFASVWRPGAQAAPTAPGPGSGMTPPPPGGPPQAW